MMKVSKYFLFMVFFVLFLGISNFSTSFYLQAAKKKGVFKKAKGWFKKRKEKTRIKKKAKIKKKKEKAEKKAAKSKKKFLDAQAAWRRKSILKADAPKEVTKEVEKLRRKMEAKRKKKDRLEKKKKRIEEGQEKIKKRRKEKKEKRRKKKEELETEEERLRAIKEPTSRDKRKLALIEKKRKKLEEREGTEKLRTRRIKKKVELKTLKKERARRIKKGESTDEVGFKIAEREKWLKSPKEEQRLQIRQEGVRRRRDADILKNPEKYKAMREDLEKQREALRLEIKQQEKTPSIIGTEQFGAGQELSKRLEKVNEKINQTLTISEKRAERNEYFLRHRKGETLKIEEESLKSRRMLKAQGIPDVEIEKKVKDWSQKDMEGLLSREEKLRKDYDRKLLEGYGLSKFPPEPVKKEVVPVKKAPEKPVWKKVGISTKMPTIPTRKEEVIKIGKRLPPTPEEEAAKRRKIEEKIVGKELPAALTPLTPQLGSQLPGLKERPGLLAPPPSGKERVKAATKPPKVVVEEEFKFPPPPSEVMKEAKLPVPAVSPLLPVTTKAPKPLKLPPGGKSGRAEN